MNLGASGPGKTAPKLIQDFLSFDPLKGVPNVLRDHPRPTGDGPRLAAPLSSCVHDYTVKWNQSLTPPLDLRDAEQPQYKVAVICKKCRIHADLRINYANATRPCPGSNNPLHHFQRAESYDTSSGTRIRYAWQCSVSMCEATLCITFHLPRLSDDEEDLLTNPELLKRRHHDLLEQDPTREGIKIASQMDSLSRLRRYIKDSLNPQHTRREFPANNKRFQEAFGINGRDCHELLGRLGFQYANFNWYLPDPGPLTDPLGKEAESGRDILEDVELELLAWMYKLSSEFGLINPHANDGWPSANRDIERTLAAQGYQRYMIRRSPAYEEHPFFSSLGALPDFADSLIEYSYDQQVFCDPKQQPYYFECLQVIAEGRQTEALLVKVATLESQDHVSRRDLTAAYRYFNIPMSVAKDTADERIISIFQAQQPDLGVAAQEEARSALYKIGLARQSTVLMSTSRQSVETYEDALMWLGNGVNTDTSDEGILAVVAIKTSDDRANEEIAQKAVSTIARARKSNMLNNWVATGRTDAWTMSVDEALRHLNIDQKLESIEPSMFPAIFESARQDRPGDMTEKAIDTIQKALAGQEGGNTASHAPETWPVGLTSHGNTCYLNSLLQYYFSIKPFRDIILDYDRYRLDTETHPDEKVERVGQRKISMVEIKGGQKFAEDLKQLFERMIKEYGTAVKPDSDLVCRAFLEPSEYFLLASNVRDEQMEVSNDAQNVVAGNESAIDEKLVDGETAVSQTEMLAATEPLSRASSTTLQASVNGDDQDVPMRNSEMPPTPPASPKVKEEKPQPEHAPPLPPRKFSTAKEAALEKAELKAKQQQDVTEVHDGAMFRLRCGMMPRSMDDSGEQEDALRDLFSIRLAETTINKGIPQKAKPLTDTGIQLNVPYEPTDIYFALDAVFDLQPYEENPEMESFKSIKALPPFLQINIPRIGFDKEKASGGAYKSEACVKLEDELYLDRYFDTSHPNTLPKRRECWAWRKQLQERKREQRAINKTSMDMDGPTAISQAADFLIGIDETNKELESVGIDPIEADGDITTALKDVAQQQAARSQELEQEIDGLQHKLDAQFADMNNIKYRLACVFFHRGSYGHGHYWIYIHDFEHDLWRSYNDERVEQFSKLEDIFEAKAWAQGTPTYAVYVADDKLDLVQAVCRAPEKPPTTEPLPSVQINDVQMGDSGAGTRPGSPPVGIDPKLIMEGGQESWDPPREVVDGAKW